MSTVSLSSNPLTTLMPQTSANQQPNFNNAFELKSIQDIVLNTLNNDLKNNMNAVSFQDQNSYNLNARINQLTNNNINPSNNVIKASSNVHLTKDNKLRNSLFNIFGKQNEGFWLGALNAANPVLDTIFGQNKGYDGKYGSTTVAIDQGYNTLSNQMMKVNPLVGGIMKGVGVAGNILNKVGGGTDGMTKLDSVFNSAPMTALTLGINGFTGKRADTITKNNEIFEQAGASYTATNDTVNRALEKSGKKYGGFSSGARHKANQLIAEAKRQQNIMTDIVDDATDRFSLRNSMAAINGNRYGFAMQGGYDQSLMRAGKHGLKVSPIIARRVVKKYQKGNKIVDPFEYYLSTLPDNQKDSTNFRVKDYWVFNGKPKDFNEALTKKMFTKKKDGYHANTVSENPETGEIEYMKSSTHPTRYMESDWYEKGLVYNNDGTVTQLKSGVEGYDNWKDFTSNYELIKLEPYWKYVRRKTPKHQQGGSITTFIELLDPNSVPEFKDGGQLAIESEIVPILIEDIEEFKEGGEFNYSTTIELVNPEDLIEPIEEFKEGGSINVIPDGALHARKHNMDIEGITKKGIPVIDNEGKQQCEIEKEEIILRLELTEKLEELYDSYKHYDTSKKEKDELALEAGKLLANEILYNTQDNTNNLL